MKDKTQSNKRVKKTILLTGATGYLGNNLFNSLVRDPSLEIIVLKRSFSNTFRIKKLFDKVKFYDIDTIRLEDVFENNKIDIILHCATDYGRKNASVLQIIEANLILPMTLIELGRKHGVQCFINTDTILDKRVSHYSLSKKQFKDWLLSYKESMVCINVALEHFYGPGDDKTKFVSYVVDSLLEKVDKIDFTEGEQKRDFIFIDDVIEAFIKIIDHTYSLSNGFYEFEIGSDNVVSIKEFVLMIKHLTENNITALNFGALPYRENEVMGRRTNLESIKKLGWSPKRSLKDGLKLTIEQELHYMHKKT